MNRRYKYRSYTVALVTIVMFGGYFNNRCSFGGGEEGCAVVEANNSALLNKDSSFYYFAQNIPIIDSNFTLSSKKEFNHLDVQSMFIPEGAGLIGRLKPIDNYEFIIYSYPADVRLPILEVYNIKGEKVNEALLYNYGYCGDPNPEESHMVEFSLDHSTIYRSTTCLIAWSNFGYDSIVVQDLISH
jgi:hypothetical protein